MSKKYKAKVVWGNDRDVILGWHITVTIEGHGKVFNHDVTTLAQVTGPLKELGIEPHEIEHINLPVQLKT